MPAPDTESFRIIYPLAVLSAGVTTLVATPIWRRWCLRLGLMDDPGHRKIHDQPIPLAGGLAVMTGLLVPILVTAFLLLWHRHASSIFAAADNAVPLLQHGLNRRGLELGGILIGALGILLVGCLDDKYELRPKTKFVGQVLTALLVAASGARITLFVPNPVFHYAVTVLWILAVINAFNFMDNMNGLCAGLGAIAAAYFAGIAAAEGQYLVALIAFLTFGALLGFLPYNFPRARAFLGDSGSHLVGYLLAVLAILPHFYTPHHPRRWAVLLPLCALAVPLGDMAWVVVLRWRMKRAFYIGDTNHLSHRLVRRGLSRTQAVLVIWLVATALGALGLLIA
jgi:UDP-GlcNAc:undecaprenyl-phosphate/decaprenyl-phosphate GlcNAc-1-phosphate transferase